MIRHSALLFAVIAAVGLTAVEGLAQEEGELGKKIARIESLLRGTQTPVSAVREEVEALLNEYTQPEEQGRLYYLLAHSYAQARMSQGLNAQKVIEYAPKALGFPLDPALRLRLYICWGDAIILRDGNHQIAPRRAEAARVYLAGLKEARALNIPDVAPKRPQLSIPNPRNEEGRVDEEHYRRQEEAQMREVRRIDELEMLHRFRGVLRDLVVYTYSREPDGDEELRKLAREILGDDPLVDQLMARVAAQRAAERGRRGQVE